MSYVRMGEDGSDVYVFFNTDGDFECCSCRLLPPESDVWNYTTKSPNEMVTHLESHRATGDCVPEFALVSLRNEGKNVHHPRLGQIVWHLDRWYRVMGGSKDAPTLVRIPAEEQPEEGPE